MLKKNLNDTKYNDTSPHQTDQTLRIMKNLT